MAGFGEMEGHEGREPRVLLTEWQRCYPRCLPQVGKRRRGQGITRLREADAQEQSGWEELRGQRAGSGWVQARMSEVPEDKVRRQPAYSMIRVSEIKQAKGKVMARLGVEGKRLVTLMGGERARHGDSMRSREKVCTWLERHWTVNLAPFPPR